MVQDMSFNLLGRDGFGQVPREVNIKAVKDSQVVAEELEWDDVEETLQAINRSRNTDSLGVLADRVIIFVAHDDRLAFTSGDLSECGLDLGVEGVAGHDDDDGHVLVNECERSVLELSSEDTFAMSIADFLDLQGTLKAGSVLISTAHDKQRLGVDQSPLCQLL